MRSRLKGNYEVGEQFKLHLKQYTASILLSQATFKKIVKTLNKIADRKARAAAESGPNLIASQDELACAYYLNVQLSNELEFLQKVANVEQKLPKDDFERILTRQKLNSEHLKEVAQGILSLQSH